MPNNGWVRTDRIMRSLHLYTGLFLMPWLLIYATSALCLNHGHSITQALGITAPQWEVVQETRLVNDDTFPRVEEDQARAILRQLGLDGAHRIQDQPDPGKMVIFRNCGSGHYRVTWQREQSSLLVEKQQPSAYRLLHFLHFQHGYSQPYFAQIAWAVIVDGMAVSSWIWVVSGVYLWARKRSKRVAGGLCVAGGSVLFLGLVILLCL